MSYNYAGEKSIKTEKKLIFEIKKQKKYASIY